MEKLIRLKAPAAPLYEPNIDTDQLIPARFLGKPRRAGFADFLLRDRRFAEDGREIPDFVLNKTAYRNSRILLAGANFGCGSSRESAVYALSDYGFRVVIAPSFGDIFAGNCIKNGFLPVMLPDAQVAELCRQIAATPGAPIAADLETLSVEAPDGSVFAFTMDPFKRQCLLEGLDEIGLTMRFADRISAHEDRNADSLRAG